VGFTARGGSSPLERTKLISFKPRLRKESGFWCWLARASRLSTVRRRSASSTASRSSRSAWATAARRSSSPRSVPNGSVSSAMTSPSSSSSRRVKNAGLNCRRAVPGARHRPSRHRRARGAADQAARTDGRSSDHHLQNFQSRFLREHIARNRPKEGSDKLITPLKAAGSGAMTLEVRLISGLPSRTAAGVRATDRIGLPAQAVARRSPAVIGGVQHAGSHLDGRR